MTTRFSEADLQAILNKRKGGIARAAALPPERRTEIAKAGAAARWGPEPRPKYRNKKCLIDGLEFDSLKEGRRYVELKNMQMAGEIQALQMQVPVRCEVNGHNICDWIADFAYVDRETGKAVFEDVKSAFTRKLPVYRLKFKLVEALHSIKIKET